MAVLHKVYGSHAVSAALNKSPDRCVDLHVLSNDSGPSGKHQELIELARTIGLPVKPVDKAELNELSGTNNHQGVLLVMEGKAHYQESDIDGLVDGCPEAPLVLALDGVQDPHNLGACLRTAEAFGVSMVIAPKDRACDITSVVRKVASGAAERVPFVRVTNLVRTLTYLQHKGLWITGAAGEAQQLVEEVDFTGPTVVVMGAEGKGLRERTRKSCDYLTAIPMRGEVGSFNVSVACGIFLYEVARQRGKA